MASFPKKPAYFSKTAATPVAAAPAPRPVVAAAPVTPPAPRVEVAPVAAPAPVAKAVAPAPRIEVAPVAVPAPVVKAVAPVAAAAPVVAAVKPVLAASAAEVSSVRETVRKATVTGVEQTRAAYERVKASAETVNATLESSFASTTKGVNEINAKAFDALRANSEAVFDLFKALLAVKSVNEAFSLQAEHGRKQFETVSAQTKEIAEMAQKLATQSVEPIKASLTKAFSASH